MPTYDYLCESCGYKFEKFQKMSDDPLKKCPKCGKEVKRLIGTGMGVIFSARGEISPRSGRKGKGFYATDYMNNGLSSGGPARRSLGEGGTCCGRAERCEKPPCSDDGVCKR
jgi:putative FmdB family regulatory protein